MIRADSAYLRVERQGVGAGSAAGRHHHSHGQSDSTHDNRDRTDFWHHRVATITQQLSRIRLHKLHREDHQRTGVERDDQGETLADKHAVAIHIRWICETPIDDATRTDRQLTEELCREWGVVRFHLAKGETATTTLVSPPFKCRLFSYATLGSGGKVRSRAKVVAWLLGHSSGSMAPMGKG